jgi:integrase
VLDAARVQGHRAGENPARWKGHLDAVLPRPQKLTRGHHAAMDVADIPEFVRRLQIIYGTSARALEFLILCASRTSEVQGMRWREIDLKEAIWVVPASRMKAGREHRVPLSARAMQILRDQRHDEQSPSPDDYVFPGARPGRPLSSMAFDMLLRRQGLEVTTHGFRSTFRVWCAERTSFPREVAEAALAHSLTDRVEAAYQRSDLLAKRRKMMEAWSAYLASKPADVIRIA